MVKPTRRSLLDRMEEVEEEGNRRHNADGGSSCSEGDEPYYFPGEGDVEEADEDFDGDAADQDEETGGHSALDAFRDDKNKETSELDQLRGENQAIESSAMSTVRNIAYQDVDKLMKPSTRKRSPPQLGCYFQDAGDSTACSETLLPSSSGSGSLKKPSTVIVASQRENIESDNSGLTTQSDPSQTSALRSSFMAADASRRRSQAPSVASFALTNPDGSLETDNHGNSRPSIMTWGRRGRRRSAQRSVVNSDISVASNGASILESMTEAMGILEAHQSNDSQHVAAAAAVVAASAQTSAKRGYIQFGQKDHVLVMLTMLGMADQGGERENYTVDPVNEHGYPKGQGKTEAQKQAPFLFVLCTVTQVHFDEDERYYTVRRCDNGKEQRADPGYMQPIRDYEAVDVALRAAKRTKQTMADQIQPVAQEPGLCRKVALCGLAFGLDFARTVVPLYTRSRGAVKTFLQHVLHGDHGYALNARFSGVNFLVLCSLIFLFEDVVLLAFLSSDWDRTAALLAL
jgi:hypothetical protein